MPESIPFDICFASLSKADGKGGKDHDEINEGEGYLVVEVHKVPSHVMTVEAEPVDIPGELAVTHLFRVLLHNLEYGRRLVDEIAFLAVGLLFD